MNEYIKMSVEQALEGIKNNEGGPFGAVIVKDNKVISCCNNRVLVDNDPTAHAEVVAIRDACKRLNTYDLSGCIIYSSCEPCPMCLSAIIWANIKEIYYGSSRVDAEGIGFRDKDIYDFFEKHTDLINEKQIKEKCCDELFDSYKNIIY